MPTCYGGWMRLRTESLPMRWSTSPLPRTYFPDHAHNRMDSEGDLLAARMKFLARQPNNLKLLLQNRYGWMEKYVKPDSIAFEVVHDGFAECLMFPLSGGVTAKTKTLELPMTVLKILDWIDGKLCRLSPGIFAMRRSIALRKRAL